MSINSTQKVIQIAHILFVCLHSDSWVNECQCIWIHVAPYHTVSQTRPLLQGHQDPSIPAVRQTERAQEQEAGHQPGRNRVNGKLETSQWFQPPPPELQFVDDELPVEVEREGRHNLQGA